MTAKSKPIAKQCFLITPIGNVGSEARKRADWIFRYVSEVCRDRGIDSYRADTMPGSPMITSRIFGAVTESDYCIADLSDLNANVFYELGIRHAVRKPIVHIAEIGTPLPFDNAQHEVVFYDLADVASVDALRDRIGSQIDAMSQAGYVVSNPLTAALGAIVVSQSSDSKDQLITQLSERLEAVERRQARSPDISQLVRDMNRTRPEDEFFHDLDVLFKRNNGNPTASDIVRFLYHVPPWRDDVVRAVLLILPKYGAQDLEELQSIIGTRWPEVAKMHFSGLHSKT